MSSVELMIAFDLTAEHRRKPASCSFTGKARTALVATLACLMALSSTNCAFEGSPEGAFLEPLAPAIESDDVWFDQLLSAPRVTDQEAKDLAYFAAEAIFNPENGVRAIPENLRRDSVPRIVFISLSNGTSTSRVVRGSGDGFVEALEEALQRAEESIENGDSPRWLKFDVVKDVSLLTDVNPERPLRLPRSLHGLAFDRASGLAWLPGELVAYTLMNSDQELRFRNMEKYLVNGSPPRDHPERFSDFGPLTLYRFITASYFSDGKEPVQLYRGHRLSRKATRDEMRSAAVAGGQYLTRAVEEDGKFVYSYLPKTPLCQRT